MHREDLLFAFPPTDFKNDPPEVVNKLQTAMDFLKDVTRLNPTRWFQGSRLIIGYNRGTKDAYWKSNSQNQQWVSLPWKAEYLTETDELCYVCSHELVHPFYRVSPLHTRNQIWGGNEGWGEGFCDFLRGPVMNRIGLYGEGFWWTIINDSSETKEQSLRSGPAEQFIRMAQEQHGSASELTQFIQWFIDKNEAIKEFVISLFRDFADRPLSQKIRPTLKMEAQYRCKGMI
jgi:hypothetical protein